jgi:hypothetical protein
MNFNSSPCFPPVEQQAKCFTVYAIKVKDEKSSFSEKHTSYEPLWLSPDNKDLASKVQDVYLKFSNKGSEGQDAPRIVVTAKLIWQA